jgi:hypothetical protein
MTAYPPAARRALAVVQQIAQRAVKAARRQRGHGDVQAALGPVGYDAAGPYVVLDSARGVFRVRPAGPGAALVGYHLALLGLGGLDPAARAAALAAHLDAALQAASADSADRSVLAGALTPLRRRLAYLEDPCAEPEACAPLPLSTGRPQP